MRFCKANRPFALADAADNLGGEPASLPPPDGEGYLLHFSRRAMACQFEVFLNAGQYDAGGELALAALDLVDELEAQLSIYRESSELSAINRSAAEQAMTVEPRLFALLAEALDISRQTDGAFDVTAGPLARVWGFVNRSAPCPRATRSPRPWPAWGANISSSTRLRGRSASTGRDSKSISAPSARGTPWIAAPSSSSPPASSMRCSTAATAACWRWEPVSSRTRRGWTVGLRDPWHPQRRIGQFHLRDRALATSGSGTQFFVHQGRRYGHILDPRSGWPASGVLSATAVAPTAAQADALSTALYVLGPERAAEFCDADPHIGCVLLCPGEQHATVKIHAFGLDAGQFEPLDRG